MKQTGAGQHLKHRGALLLALWVGFYILAFGHLGPDFSSRPMRPSAWTRFAVALHGPDRPGFRLRRGP